MSGTPVAVPFNTSGESTKTSAGRTTANGGTFFVVISEAAGQAGTQTPTDLIDGLPSGNTFSQLGTTQVAATAGSQLRVYKCENGNGGTNHTATVAWGGGNTSDASMWFIECPGVATASIDAGSLGQTTDSSPPYTVGTGTVDAAVDQFLTFISGAWAGPYDPTTTAQPFVLLDEETNSGLYWTGGVAYRNGTGATTATWTCPSSSQCAVMIIGLKPAAAGGGIAGAGQIASAEAFGNPGVGGAVSAAGIASAEAFGSPILGASVAPAGIASTQAFGSPVVSAGIVASGIASVEALGAATAGAGIVVAALPSAEAFGAPVVGGSGVFASGIPSSEAVGAPSIGSGIVGLAIASAEAVSAPGIAARVVAQGLASGEAFGLPVIGGPLQIVCLGIPSAEALGGPRVGGLEWAPEIYLVPPENRLLRVRAENRLYRVPPENRILKVKP